jgi:Fe-S oxidoreductase
MQAAVDVAQPKNPIDTTEDCRFCWMCRQACPVGHVTARETLTPHGWALTIDAVKRGHIAWTDETIDVLYACADCGLCRAHCITDRPLPEAITAVRAELVAKGQAPAIVEELNQRLLRDGSVYGKLAIDPAASNVAAPPTSPARRVDLEKSAPAGTGAGSAAHAGSAGTGVGASGQSGSAGVGDGSVPPTVGRATVVGGVGESVAAGSTVGLFIGDAAGHFGAAAVEAVVRLLETIGIAPVLVGRGRSNGVVAASLGLRETGALLARRVVEDIAASGCREVLVLTPEDRFGFEQVYAQRLGVSWPPSVRIREVSAVLAEGLAAGSLRLRQLVNAPAYAYHDPCHTARIDRNDEAPRALLRAVLGADSERNLFWRGRRAHPCGAVGGLQFTQPTIAAKLAEARLDDALAAGASWLITDDPACAHHLRSRGRQGIAVRGFYELLAEQLVG